MNQKNIDNKKGLKEMARLKSQNKMYSDISNKMNFDQKIKGLKEMPIYNNKMNRANLEKFSKSELIDMF